MGGKDKHAPQAAISILAGEQTAHQPKRPLVAAEGDPWIG